ncbi:MAG: hypothetical protein HKN16_12875 [Saprospiraceae bacterium]|nr:hypothetical protein [Saprospiraceae bacterium]
MKTTTLFAMLMMASGLLFCQRDYCICMETSSYLEIESFVASTQNQLITQETSPTSQFQLQYSNPRENLNLLEKSSLEHPIENKPSSKQAEEVEDDFPQYPIKSQAEVLRSQKKLFKVKRKRNKRGKRFKGQCPIF